MNIQSGSLTKVKYDTDVYEIGTMLYHPYRNMLGWVVELNKRFLDNGYKISYTVEWADGKRNSTFYLTDWYKAFHQLANER